MARELRVDCTLGHLGHANTLLDDLTPGQGLPFSLDSLHLQLSARAVGLAADAKTLPV